MALVMVPVDVWVCLDDDGALRFFVRTDDLTDADYKVRTEHGLDADMQWLEVRCLTMLPAGFILRIHLGALLERLIAAGERFREISTDQFRKYTDEPTTGEFRPAELIERARVIRPDQIRRAIEGGPPAEGAHR